MNKRLTIMLLVLLGAVLFMAHTAQSQIKLIATRIEMNGEVKLAWNKAAIASGTTQYNIYRAMLPDTAGVLIATRSDTTYVDHVPPVLSPLPQVFAYRVVAKTGLVLEASNTLLVSVPGTPVIGAFRLEGKLDQGKVKLYWSQPAVGTVNYYLVYRGVLGEPAGSHVQIDSTKDLFSVKDAPVVSSASPAVTYVFYVKAKLSSGETVISTTVQLTVYPSRTNDEVRFVSVPPLYGQAGIAYQYTAKAVSNDVNAVIRYYAEGATPGYKIDSVSGAVNWTPAAKGSYKLVIIARSNKGGSAKQEFIVLVSGGNGIIQGKVTDTVPAPNTTALPNVIIEVFKTENSNTLTFAYSAKTDNNGNYRITRVDPGVYKIKASAPSGKYQSQWYEGKRDAAGANPVTVNDSSVSGPTIVPFKLRGGTINAPLLKITGTVTDSAGVAIADADARVLFVRADFALNFGGSLTAGGENFRKFFDLNRQGDFRLEGNSEFVFRAKVDSTGKYTVNLPPGGYIALARAKAYAVEFYNEQANILSAEILRLQRDTAGINFTLSPLPPVVLGAISGTVSDSVHDVMVPARVIAFRDGWRFNDQHKVGRVYVTDTDSLGGYRFDDVLPGTYLVLALPLGNYAPAFYSADTMNLRWKNAGKVTVNGNSVDNINIYVRQLGSSANGFTAIVGSVSFGNGNGMMNGMNRAGAVVYARKDGEIAGYAFTNAEGQYAITNLAPGQYTVSVDKAGFSEGGSVTAAASYDLSGNPQVGTANFSIDAVLGVTVTSTAVPEAFLLEQNYPNPFNPSTTISFALPKGETVSLKVYNIVGQEVATLIDGYKEAGSYSVRFDASRMASGVYLYRLQSGAITEVRKMLLMK